MPGEPREQEGLEWKEDKDASGTRLEAEVEEGGRGLYVRDGCSSKSLRLCEEVDRGGPGRSAW